MKKVSIAGLLAVALFGVGFLVSSRARATVTSSGQVASCQVSGVAYVNDQLIVSCAGVGDFMAFGPAFTGCGQKQSEDSMKTFLNISETALLSGRRLTVNWANDDTCTAGTAFIYLRMF